MVTVCLFRLVILFIRDFREYSLISSQLQKQHGAGVEGSRSEGLFEKSYVCSMHVELLVKSKKNPSVGNRNIWGAFCDSYESDCL